MAAEVKQGGFEEKWLSIKEAQRITGRKLDDAESREELTKLGAQFTGKGRSNRIPMSAVEKLGWVREGVDLTAGGADPDVEALASEISKLEKRIARNKEQIALDNADLREAKRRLSAITKASLKQAEKEAEEAVAKLERLRSLSSL